MKMKRKRTSQIMRGNIDFGYEMYKFKVSDRLFLYTSTFTTKGYRIQINSG